ncbi:S24 family peptidase [Halomonas cupida]|uniref:S24 family peptidase n=1 Tax=Halomonas cupida TaxID=44933 RepID=UPI003A8D6FA0
MKDISQIRLDNARALADQVGGTGEFASRIDREPTQASRFMGRNPTKGIGNRMARHIEDCFGKPRGWLDTDHAAGLDADDGFTPRSPSEEDYALIEQLTVNGDCGNGYHNDHVEVRGGLVFKRDWIKRMGSKPENLKVIYATGDSMEPYIVDGDVVLLDLSKTDLVSGKAYVIHRPDGEVSIKRITQRLSGTWMISSDNPNKVAYPDEEMSVTSAAQVPIIGQVIWRGGAMA